MYWADKRYHSLNYHLRHIFGEKVFKISLDGGFTCPNRDGTISKKGCIFCSEGGSGEFAGSRSLSISEQFDHIKTQLSSKWTCNKYIAYFQAYSNTYGPVDQLEQKYMEALSQPGVVGLAIATRPDCITPEVLELLDFLNKKTYLWVELGLQTMHESTAKFIQRGYSLSCYEEAILKLRQRNIHIVTHLILGLPYESKEQILESISYLGNSPIQGVKLHLMHVLRNTPLETLYLNQEINVFSKEDYIQFIVKCLELLPPHMVIHRVTGDGPKDLLIAPHWSRDKRSVLNGIDRELRFQDSWQGKLYIGSEKTCL